MKPLDTLPMSDWRYVVNYALLSILTGLICITIHIPSLPLDILATSDTARLINDSAMAAWAGGYQYLDYTLYSSPLYSELFRVLFSTGLLTLDQAPWFSAVLTLFASGVASASIFVWVMRISNSTGTALITVTVLQFVPIYWISSVYAFPAMLSLALLSIAIVTFDFAVARGWRAGSLTLSFLAALFLILATLTKVDAVLAMPIFCLSVWRSPCVLKSKIIWTLGLAFVGLLVLVIFDLYARWLTPEAAPLGGFDRNFPMSPDNLFSRGTLDLAIRALGPGTFLCGMIALVWGLRLNAKTVFWLVAASIPLFLFWGLRPPNEARHWLIPAVFFTVCLSMPLAYALRRAKAVWAAVITVAVIAGYFFHPPGKGTPFPSSRLFASTPLIHGELRNHHSVGCAIAHADHSPLVVFSARWKTPHLKYEILRTHSADVAREQIGPFARFTVHNKEYWVWDIGIPPNLQDLHWVTGRGVKAFIDDMWLDDPTIAGLFPNSITFSQALGDDTKCQTEEPSDTLLAVQEAENFTLAK